jgi:hypothetical protein
MFNEPPNENRVAKYLDATNATSSNGSKSVGDALIAGCYGAKIEVIRFTDDDDEVTLDVQYEIRGSIPASDDSMLTFSQLLASLRRPRLEGGAA